ncbi:hypothetical protein V5O48_010776 [Marasmius crinis-equi]|uniref:Uncharacterized protein n=1 Tax=Marasmius crinis-equi TaxID=585013 RepID=A0ABR3F7H2_9AGAR
MTVNLQQSNKFFLIPDPIHYLILLPLQILARIRADRVVHRLMGSPESEFHVFIHSTVIYPWAAEANEILESSATARLPNPFHTLTRTSAGQSLGKPDRSSSASLPLPAQIPYHTLPRAHLLSTNNLVDGNASGEGSSSSSSGSDESTNTLPSAGTSSPSGAGPSQLFREPPPPHSPKTQSSFRQPPPPPPLPPQPHSATFSSYATTPIASFQPPNFSLPSAYPTANKSTLPYLAEDESSQNYMTALRRPIKPPAASHPPVILEEASGSSTASGISRSASTGSSSAHAHAIQGMPGQPSSTTTSQDVWRNPPPVQPPRASPSPRPIGGMVNPSDLPPVLPPQRMRSSVGHGSGSGGGGVLNNATTPTPMSNSFSAPAASGSGANASTSVPLPHTPPNPYSATQTQTLMANSTFHTSSTSASPAYAPFLSPLQPPPERCWIEVETTPMEYKLHIRLEGFKRDGITLATRRRRILHIVADSWDTEGGGHFERRISFGYDADLVGVRAEFDGEEVAEPEEIEDSNPSPNGPAEAHPWALAKTYGHQTKSKGYPERQFCLCTPFSPIPNPNTSSDRHPKILLALRHVV